MSVSRVIRLKAIVTPSEAYPVEIIQQDEFFSLNDLVNDCLPDVFVHKQIVAESREPVKTPGLLSDVASGLCSNHGGGESASGLSIAPIVSLL